MELFNPKTKPMNSKVTLVARILLGLMLVIFGANKFFSFMPAPEMPEAAGKFMGALADTGYMFPLIAIIEIVCGLLFLIGKKIPLALLIWAPVAVNILLFHIVLAPEGLLMGAITVILTLILFVGYWNKLKTVS